MSKAQRAPSPAEPFETAGTPAAPAAAPEPEFVTLSHDALFTPAQSLEERCDACGIVLAKPADDDDDGYRVRGQGVYYWVRGEEPRFEKAPLCPSCAAAIGMTALARWEIEEEEG
jgi:hypothetical protein